MSLIMIWAMTVVLLIASLTLSIVLIRSKSTVDIYALSDEFSGLKYILDFTRNLFRQHTDFDIKTISLISDVLYDGIGFIEGSNVQNINVSEKDTYYFCREILDDMEIKLTDEDNKIFRRCIQVIYLFAK